MKHEDTSDRTNDNFAKYKDTVDLPNESWTLQSH